LFVSGVPQNAIKPFKKKHVENVLKFKTKSNALFPLLSSRF
jgi:hypothetical protein